MEDILKGTIDLDAKVKALALPNKEKSVKKAASQSVRKQIMTAFEQIGGEDEFARFIKKDDRNRREFYGWWAKLAPKEEGNAGPTITINVVNFNGTDNDSISIPAAILPASCI